MNKAEVETILSAHRAGLRDRGGNSLLDDAYLLEVDLRGIDLRGASLIRANLAGANLSLADLRGAYLLEADLRGACLLGAKLAGATMVGVTLHDTILSKAASWELLRAIGIHFEE